MPSWLETLLDGAVYHGGQLLANVTDLVESEPVGAANGAIIVIAILFFLFRLRG